MGPFQKTDGDAMNHLENIQEMNIQAFIAASREYFALDDKPGAARQQTAVSTVIARLQRTSVNSYRKVAQSLFLAVGFGAFVAGPAMADPGCGRMGSHQEHHARMMEQHHKQLHDALKLTPEQEAGWTKLMESEQPRTALSGGKPDDWAKLNAPERAEKMLELSKARQVQMAEHVTALKAFYATLTPEQQKTFEAQHVESRQGMRGKMSPKAPVAEKDPAAS
jgi:protein CpxP